jgi:maleamate amidohydrolase
VGHSANAYGGRPWESVFSDEERQTYEMYRRPDREAVLWSASALLVSDVTLGFLGSKVPTLEAARELRTACGMPAWETLPVLRMLLDSFRGAGRPVIYTRPAQEPRLGGASVGRSEGALDARVPAEIEPAYDDLVLDKTRASAFFGTPLAAYLIRSAIRALVLVGGTTSGCVRITAVEASSLGFSVAIAHDACFDRSKLSHAVALTELDVKYATVLEAAVVAAAVDNS